MLLLMIRSKSSLRLQKMNIRKAYSNYYSKHCSTIRCMQNAWIIIVALYTVKAILSISFARHSSTRLAHDISRRCTTLASLQCKLSIVRSLLFNRWLLSTVGSPSFVATVPAHWYATRWCLQWPTEADRCDKFAPRCSCNLVSVRLVLLAFRWLNTA